MRLKQLRRVSSQKVGAKVAPCSGWIARSSRRATDLTIRRERTQAQSSSYPRILRRYARTVHRLPATTRRPCACPAGALVFEAQLPLRRLSSKPSQGFPHLNFQTRSQVLIRPYRSRGVISIYLCTSRQITIDIAHDLCYNISEHYVHVVFTWRARQSDIRIY